MAEAPRHVRVFLASPGDVVDEREIALAVLDDLQYDPLLRGKVTVEQVAWDKRGAGAPMLAGLTPQDSIERGLPRPSECDVVVVIFWSRMGTPLPSSYQKEDGTRYESGTEWEYAEAVAAFRKNGAPYVLLYRRTQPVMLDADAPDFDERRAQYDRVKRFFDGQTATGGVTPYATPADFRERLEHDVKSLIARILEEKPRAGHATHVALPEPWKGSPFPGLRAFTAADAPIFFGRERDIDRLAARVLEQPFVAVVGASGSGKSSLVAAGLIPRLQLTAGSAGAQSWVVLQLTPDRLGTGDPFASFAAAILHALPHTQQKGLAAKLREDAALAATLLPPRTLVFVDQFEELFTTIQPSLRAPFVEMLGRVRTIITVRADFYGHCVEMQSLARLMANGTFPLAAPGVAALHDMITRPAARAALTFEPDLPQRILDDTGQEPGALALMAYTLDELYRRGLTRTAYEELGGVQGAIGKRSESVFSALGDEERAALPRVFRELVEVDERGTATRQRAPLARVATTPAAERLTQALTDARLLVSSYGDGNEPVVEVAHEALFRSWPRLTEWIAEAADDLRLLRQVRVAAAEWNRSGRRDDFLWSHERLAPVYALRDRMEVEFEPVVAEFIRPEYERIVDVVRSSRSELRQRVSIERLVEIGPSAAGALVDCLQFATTRQVRLEIYGALAGIRDFAVPRLLNAVIDTSFGERASAVHALVYVDSLAASHLVPQLVEDGDPGVRAATALLAAHSRACEHIPALCLALRDPADDVRCAVLSALATFQSQTALDGVIFALHNDDANVVIALELVSALAGDRLDNRSPWLHTDAKHRELNDLISANGILRDVAATTRVLQAVAPLARHTDPIVRRPAREAMEQLLNSPMIGRLDFNAASDATLDKFFLAVANARDEAKRFLVELVHTSDPRLRIRAVQTIRDLAGRFVSRQFDFYGNEYSRLREQILSPNLTELLVWVRQHDADGHVRHAAHLALQAIALVRGG